MRILHLSDTHSRHRELHRLPAADILVHSGDFTRSGSEAEAMDFMNWFCDLSYAHKIFIAGNHDLCMYGAESIDGLPANVHYLCYSGVEIGGLRFYGVPLFMPDFLDGTYWEQIRQIPMDTDVLVSHQPPYSVGDLADYGQGLQPQGCRELWERVQQLHPCLHLFGHEHDANGVFRKGDTVFSNAALLNSHYQFDGRPHVLDTSACRREKMEGE